MIKVSLLVLSNRRGSVHVDLFFSVRVNYLQNGLVNRNDIVKKVQFHSAFQFRKLIKY